MSMSPSNLLARLDELRKWQEIQQERLQKQHKARLERTTDSTNSAYETIEGLSAYNSTIHIDPQENEKQSAQRPTSSGQEVDVTIHQSEDKPKKPFLKRGSGLVRFNMKPGEQKRQSNKNLTRNNNTKSNESNGRNDGFKVTPLKKPEISFKAVWQNVSPGDASTNEKEVKRNLLRDDLVLQINEYAALNFDETPVSSKIDEYENEVVGRLPEKVPSEQAMYEKALEHELLIFEALEEKAMHSSFCSTNSSIVRLLSSTPTKYKDVVACASPRKCATIQEVETSTDENGADGARKCVQFANDSNPNVVDDDDESKRSSSNSSVDSDHFTNEIVTNANFKDDEAWSDTVVCSPENSSVNVSLTSTVSVESSAASCARKSNENANVEKQEDTKKGNDPDEALTKKLEELDLEIQNFRKENAKVQRTKIHFDREAAAFKKEKKAFEKYVLEEKIKVEFYLEDEKKKLTKEKMVFDRYVKDFQNRTTRKEREEISSLKQELADLRESSKLKETRNATSQARLRNQIKSYEKETSNLKDEIESLRKQNAKLQSAQKFNRKITDTKMLHAINKNLSKLTKDVKNKADAPRTRKDVSDSEAAKKAVDCDDSPSPVRSSLEAASEDDKSSSEGDGSALLANRSQETRFYEDYTKVFNRAVERGADVKENDRNSGNVDVMRRRSHESDLVKSYESVFGRGDEISGGIDEVNKTKTEITLPDGSKELTYPNGNVKTTSPDGNFILLRYFNGDVKETKLMEGTVRYYYAESGTWHTTFADGTELLEFSNGQSERRLKDGCVEVSFPNGVTKVTRPDGTETVSYPDGTKVNLDANGEKILFLPNGQKEVHNDQHKRREYPDGTVKILYPDGVQETRYSNGRIRIKDGEGRLLLDSHDENT